MPVSKFLTSRLSSKIWYSSLLAGNQQFLGNRGAYDSIATTTVGAGGASSITFSSIPSTYTHLQIRSLIRGTNATSEVETFITYNGTATNYFGGHQVYGQGTSVVSDVDNRTTANYLMYSTSASGTSGIFAGSITDILDYRNTSKNKIIRSLGGFDANGTGYVVFRSGLWINTAAITSITITAASGNLSQHSSFALYGIKGD
jgi:hypothetical protein